VTNAVFTHSPSSRYDDLPEQRYPFPRTYLNQVREAVGEWIVYYELRRTSGRGGAHGRQACFAVAFVQGVQPDPRRRAAMQSSARDPGHAWRLHDEAGAGDAPAQTIPFSRYGRFLRTRW